MQPGAVGRVEASPAPDAPPLAAPNAPAGGAALGRNTSFVTPPFEPVEYPRVAPAPVELAPAGQTVLPWSGPTQLGLDGREYVPTASLTLRTDPEDGTPLGGPVAPAPGSGQLQLALDEPNPTDAKNQLELFARRRNVRMNLRDDLRPHALSERVRKCGRTPIGPVVGIHIADDDGRAFLSGIVRCGSVWACPCCGAAICAERAEELQDLIRWAGGTERAFLATFTIRHHGLGHHFGSTLAGVADAWRFMARGSAWQRWRSRVGLIGDVRAIEATHGPRHGWHPHLHVLILARDTEALHRSWDWLAQRWMSSVAKALGEEHVPDEEIGFDLRPCTDVDYLAKLGLELATPGTKEAKHGNRTVGELARDVAEFARPADVELWKDYQRSTHGHKHLTWSRGLRAAAGLDDRDDEEIVEAETRRPARLVYIISRKLWDVVRAMRGQVAAALAAAERGGGEAVDACMRAAVRSRAEAMTDSRAA